MPLGDDLAEVLSIQEDRTSDPKDPIMRRRKELVERRIPAELERILEPIDSIWKAEGSGGKGAPAEVPWTRFFDPELSARAGIGWYVVYLFSAAGDAVYLSLNQGTTTWNSDKQSFMFRTPENLEARVESARKILRASGLVTSFDGINLRAKQKLGRAYQAGNVHAIRYSTSQIPWDGQLTADVQTMAELLESLYESELRGIDFERPQDLSSTVLAARAPRPGGASPTPVDVGVESAPSDVVLASVTDDETAGPDMLGIDAHARALATVIAAKQSAPPLAVALYGEWGSGKTYFMHRVETHIKRFGRGDRDGLVFEPATGHIRFRAWHYERGHLMASLHRQIFEALDLRGPRSDRELREANRNIAAAKDELHAATAGVSEAEEARNNLKDEIGSVRAQHDNELEELKAIDARDIWEHASPQLEEQITAATRDLNLPAARESALDLLRAAQEVQALGSRIKLLGTPRGRWWSSPLVGAALAMLIVLAVTMVLGLWLSEALRSMGTTIGVVASMATGLAAGVTRQIGVVRRFLEPAEQLQAMVEGRLEAKRDEQQLQIDELEQELSQAEEMLTVALAHEEAKRLVLNEAERRRDELTPAVALQRFIADRADTAEYDEHLGVVTRIHHDLHELSRRLHAALSDPDSVLKRIVLYIDDLDRCSPETVVAVLEAVHLFLALPHFVVIMGVDHRSLEGSLRTEHPGVLAAGDHLTTPADYLEKIFQLTFTLPAMTEDGCRAILRDAIDRRPVFSELEIGGVGVTEEEDPEAVPDEAVEGAGSPSRSGEDPAPARDLARQTEEQHEFPIDPYVIRSLDITDSDLEFLDLVAPMFATTPRRAKRFLTIYTVVRARLAALDYDAAAVALLVAALVGAPNTLGRVLRVLDPAASAGRKFGDLPRRGFHDPLHPAESDRVASFVASAGSLTNVAVEAIVAYRKEVLPYTIGINSDVPEFDIVPAGGDA
ncbi:MrcB family domain-containing protein [Nocardia sp. NPDC002869]|uniref:MrcB family domain-containing protein n=1 Tax=Nocardia sp. NPDC002869 TaxID=3161032 RepID=UPI00398D4CB6